MPTTNAIELLLNGQKADLPEQGNLGMTMSYKLEEEGNFENKLSSHATGITLPATTGNDKIFNTFHNPQVEDMTPNNDFRRNMEAEVKVNGVTILKGKGLLQEAGFGDRPIDYVVNVWGNNADWVITARTLTLYECLSEATHTFDVATVMASWSFDGWWEGQDYVYAPVRYRQPFGVNDDQVDIYHLRPSLFVYWMLIRGFRALGYTVKSQFFDTAYFRGLVMPWTWGNFFDISNDLVTAIGFKACGFLPNKSAGSPMPPSGADTSDHYTTMVAINGDHIWVDFETTETSYYERLAVSGGLFPDVTATGDYPIYSGPFNGLLITGGISTFPAGPMNWQLSFDYPTQGHDTLGGYTFDEGTGIGTWTYALPVGMSYLSTASVTATFILNLMAYLFDGDSSHSVLILKVEHSGSTSTTDEILLATVPTLMTPVATTFSVSNLLPGDTVTFQLIWRVDALGSGGSSIRIAQALWINQNPSGAASWVPQYSSLTLDRLFVPLGGTVNFKWYTVFKNYQFLDFLGGLVDCFNLQIQTDTVNKEVLIEPTYSVNLPGGVGIDGYYKRSMINDWNEKLDLSKRNTMALFSDHERQIDFTFKQDGGDGAQNIWAARHKGVYLNNLSGGKYSDPYQMNNQSGIRAAVPGSSRYVLPDRFNTGNRQKVNRFFSAVMHVRMDHWAHYSSEVIPGIPDVAAQIIAIIPEGERSGIDSLSQIFEPKLAYYRGQYAIDPVAHGYWYWKGDPDNPERWPLSQTLPLMYSVYYGSGGENELNLNYNDEYINGVIVPGLMRTFFLRRLAMMRNGQMLKGMMRLKLIDIANPYHREFISLKQSLFALIGIEGYNPLRDDSSVCTMWKVVETEQKDIDASYPSVASITTDPTILDQNDLRYAHTLIYSSDLPGI